MNERRLATVVRVRVLRERIARAEVGQRRRTVAEHEAHRDQAWQLVHDRPRPASTEASVFMSHRVMLQAGVREAVSAGDAVHTAEHAVDDALSDWREEARRLDGIERLAERLAAETALETERSASVELDDLVVTRWQRGSIT